jgi:hypothetical protein
MTCDQARLAGKLTQHCHSIDYTQTFTCRWAMTYVKECMIQIIVSTNLFISSGISPLHEYFFCCLRVIDELSFVLTNGQNWSKAIRLCMESSSNAFYVVSQVCFIVVPENESIVHSY